MHRPLIRLIFLLAGVLLWAGPLFAAAPGPLDTVTRATVALDCKAPGGTGSFIGTGVVVHELGYVLTSTTTIPPGAHDIHCHFVGPQTLPARLIVADEKLELAVVKVDVPKDWAPLSVIRIGDSKNLQVGQTVVTIGDAYSAFPRSGKFTTSLGIVSGLYELKRQIAPQPVYVGRVIETTATVAPGMDGGPILDGSGRLLGLCSLNTSDCRWMGVAVPIDVLADRMLDEIRKDAKATLGIKEAKVTLPSADRKAPPLFPNQQRLDETFRLAAAKAAKSVVAIDVNRRSEKQPTSRPVTTRPQPRQPGPPGRPRPAPPPTGPYKDFFVRPKALVTGVVVTDQGHILTTYYNVSGELNSIAVVTPAGKRVDAKLISYDEAHDLAMLKVDPKELGLKPIELAQEQLDLTQQIATVGRSPDPATFTMSRGIVSAIGRRADHSAFQMDAEVNYANAGAPVIDSAGRCVGLVTNVRPDAIWGQNSGIGFATSAQAIRGDLVAMREGRTVDKPKRGYMGVQMSNALVEGDGVLIERVQDPGPAHSAGLLDKDVITRVDDKPVNSSADISNLVGGRKPGETVRLTIRRGDKTLTIDVTLGEHPYQ